MSHDVADDPTYNAFAEHPISQGFYSSAFLPSLTNVRRRPSPLRPDEELDLNQRMGNPGVRLGLDNIPPKSPGLHPLKSALVATTDLDSLSDNTHITRPNLSRIVNGDQNPVFLKDETAESSSNLEVANEEKDVIVHHVTPKDSLAGVSLRYGITLANLRRANQLWTSDSIHRRSVLYIPIEAASRAQEYIQETNFIPVTTPGASEEATNVFHDAYSFTSRFDGNKSDVGLTNPSINVVRVPAKQLTYFPPSSTKNLESRSSRHSLDNLNSDRLSPIPSNKHDLSLLNNSLTSILTALPIAASTRDKIITRLSFDSVSSSYSDTSRVSPDEENGHELGEVRKLSRERKDKLIVSLSNEADVDDMSMPTPKACQQTNSLPPIPTTIVRQSSRASGSSSKSSHIRSISSCSPPRFYVSQPYESFIRTSQPEPSPAMEIPTRPSTLGSASSKKLQATFGVKRKSSKDIDLHSVVQRMSLQDHLS